MEKKEYIIKVNPQEFMNDFEIKLEHLRALTHAIRHTANRNDTNPEMVESLGELAEKLTNELMGFLYNNFGPIVADNIMNKGSIENLEPLDRFCGTIDAAKG